MAWSLYFGGPIWTMEQRQATGAVLVEDGVIRAVGDAASAHPQARTAEQIDLQGKSLLPAFLDPHSHFMACANAMLQLSVAQARSFSDLQDILRDHLDKTGLPAGQWLLARDFDPSDLKEQQVPDRAVLDAAAPQNPVVLQHRSGHVGVLNSLALQNMGITDKTPDPAGGHIARRDGRLTGYLEENAFLEVLNRLPPPSLEQLLQACDRAQDYYASFGITTVQEGMLTAQMAPLYQALCAQRRQRLDVMGYSAFQEREQVEQALGKLESDHFRLAGYKIFLDGSPQSCTAWMRTNYEGRESRGYPTLQDEQVLQAICQAVQDGRQLLAHCNGDAAAEQYLQMLERAAAQGADLTKARPVMIHAQLVGLDQLPRLRALGVTPSFFAAHVYHWGEVHRQNVGPVRAAGISPAASAGDLGLAYTFHQDAPVLPPDMLETVWCAVNRLTKAGNVLGGAERVSAYDALRAVTLSAALQYGQAAEKGSIAPGKRADFVILDRDPMAVASAELREVKVEQTICRGRVLYRKS